MDETYTLSLQECVEVASALVNNLVMFSEFTIVEIANVLCFRLLLLQSIISFPKASFRTISTCPCTLYYVTYSNNSTNLSIDQ